MSGLYRTCAQEKAYLCQLYGLISDVSALHACRQFRAVSRPCVETPVLEKVVPDRTVWSLLLSWGVRDGRLTGGIAQAGETGCRSSWHPCILQEIAVSVNERKSHPTRNVSSKCVQSAFLVISLGITDVVGEIFLAASGNARSMRNGPDPEGRTCVF